MQAPDKYTTGLLDTSVLVDLARLTAESLPELGLISTISLAELLQGVHLATDPVERAARIEHSRNVELSFPVPLPFDTDAARVYGSLVALIVAAGRSPRPRQLDLMIAAIAVAHKLPLFTRNADDFVGLERRLTVVAV